MQEACKITKVCTELREKNYFWTLPTFTNIKYVILECPSKAITVFMIWKSPFPTVRRKVLG